MTEEEPAMTTTTTRYDFRGCPAYLKQVLGQYTCEVWMSYDAAKVHDATRVVTLDLRRTPRFAGADEVEVDDYVRAGGTTTLGPCWPDSESVGGAGHPAEAAVYVSDRLWEKHKGWIERDDRERDFQTQARCYVDRATGKPNVLRRYYGFLAKLHHLEGRIAAFEVFQLTDPTDKPGRQIWVNLDDRAHCDELEAVPAPGGEVGLFLALPFARRNSLSAGKIPRGLGENVAFVIL